VASSILQPIFQINSAKVFACFPEVVWEHAQRSAHAAIPHAALVERADAFGAELLCLISGLAQIILFRAPSRLSEHPKHSVSGALTCDARG